MPHPLFTKKSLIALAVFCAALIVILYLMGRTFLLEGCGLGLWTSSPNSHCTSQMFADPYSSSHFLHGIIFFFFLWFAFRKMPLEWKFVWAAIIEIAWEILENSSFIINRYRTATSSNDYFGDSIYNSCADLLFCMLGFYIAAKVPWKVSLAILVAIELIMLATIKDNLALNVLMLVYPVEAIKNWQMGL